MKKRFEELLQSSKDVFSRYEELILDQAELINNAADLLKMTSEMYSYIARLLQDAEASEIVKKNGEHMLAMATELAKYYDAVHKYYDAVHKYYDAVFSFDVEDDTRTFWR